MTLPLEHRERLSDQAAPLRVLLVEDDDAHVELIERTLSAHFHNFELISAPSLQKAREAVAFAAPDIAFVDLRLPDGNGIDLLANEAGFPIIIISGQGSESTAADAIKAGALDYVVKSSATLSAIHQTAERGLLLWQERQKLRRTEDALRTAELFSYFLLHSQATPICVLNADGVIQTVNQSWKTLAIKDGLPTFGVEAGVNYLTLCQAVEGANESQAKRLSAGIQAVLEHRRDTFSLDYPCQSDSEPRWFSTRVARMELPGTFSVILAHEEITERKRNEATLARALAEAEQANHAKSDFLANMSHELRTPLNAIIGFSEVLEACFFGPLNDKQKEYCRNVHESGTHLLTLINQILDLSKIESGHIDMADEQVSLRDVIRSSLNMLAERARQRGIKISQRLPRNLPIVRADGRLIKQVLLNLFTNAVKFTPSGGAVTVSARYPVDDGLQIIVADTGCGIPADNLRHMFKPFNRGNPMQTRHIEGSGLGLAICKNLIERHQGHISVTSEVNVGTRVTVWLPPQRVIQDAVLTIADSPISRSVPYEQESPNS